MQASRVSSPARSHPLKDVLDSLLSTVDLTRALSVSCLNTPSALEDVRRVPQGAEASSPVASSVISSPPATPGKVDESRAQQCPSAPARMTASANLVFVNHDGSSGLAGETYLKPAKAMDRVAELAPSSWP